MDYHGEANKDKEDPVIIHMEVQSEAVEEDVLHHPPISDQKSR
jgi:hypothetical protein